MDRLGLRASLLAVALATAATGVSVVFTRGGQPPAHATSTVEVAPQPETPEESPEPAPVPSPSSSPSPEPAASASAEPSDEADLDDGGVIGYDERPGGVVVPVFGPPEAGVATNVRQVDARTDPGWNANEEYTADGMKLRLDRCTMRAPGQWVVRGRVENLRAGGTRARVHLGLPGSRNGFNSAVWDVVFTGPGRFALAADTVAGPGAGSADNGVSPRSPLHRFDCGLSARSPDVPVGWHDDLSSADPTFSSEPVEYRAPAGTTQALGIGAKLGGSDPRLPWAYAAWEGRPLPIADVWVPAASEGHTAPGPHTYQSTHDFCRWVDQPVLVTTESHVLVHQYAECEAEDPDRRPRGAPVEGAAGFFWFEADAHQPLAARNVDGIVVTDVTGPSRDTIADVTRSLRQHRNGVVTPPVEGGPMGPDLDVAIRNALARENFTERTRLPYRGDGFVVAAIQQQPQGLVSPFYATQSESGWVVRGGGGAGMGPCITYSGGWSRGQGAGHLVVTTDPKHLVEQKRDDGSWERLDTKDGVYFLDLPDAKSTGELGTYRAVDSVTGLQACD